MESHEFQRKPRVVCLHGFRGSGAVLQQMVSRRWPKTVLDKMDLVFVDAPFPAQGVAGIEGSFDPPFYEWFHLTNYHHQGYHQFHNFEKCIAFLEDYMITHGPFDGLLGFSQGGALAAALLGMQREEVALTKVPAIKFVIIISGVKLGGIFLADLPSLAAKAYSLPLDCPSLHFIGELDFLQQECMALMHSFVDPMVIHHPARHILPRLDKKSEQMMLSFIERFSKANNKKILQASL